MMNMIGNMDLYRTFLEAASCGSFSGAAAKLFISQPAVSGEIGQLEQELGVKLFFRTGRGVKLTPEGEVLLEFVQRGIAFLESGEEKLREAAALEGGVMRVGASDMTLRFYLLDHLERFRREHPRVKLTVTNAPTPRSLASLKAGMIDFCVISEPAEADGDIEMIPVREIEDIMVASPELGLGDELLHFDQLEGEVQLMLEPGTSTRSFVEAWLKKCGAPMRLLEPDIELATSDLVLEFARRGMGVATIVEDFAREDIEAGRLERLKLAEPFPRRRFLLCYLKRVPLSAATKAFIKSVTG